VNDDIRQAWQVPASLQFIERNAVGLAWISHPVTVQSGALIVQELLRRPEVHKDLRAKAAQLGSEVWENSNFRDLVRNHVLELMRFRPIFPLLARDVPRDTEFETGARRNAPCPGGGKIRLCRSPPCSIRTQFPQPAVLSSRKWGNQDLRPMPGYGTGNVPLRITRSKS
jgi:hypothetical protein